MPSKVVKNGRTRWLACVKAEGKRKQKICSTKAEALEWEVATRKSLKQSPKEETETHMVSLGEWANSYLDYAEVKLGSLTFREKKAAFRRFFAEVNPDIQLENFTARHALNYLQNQAKKRSGNSCNKDRKNLAAAWNWAVKFYNIPPNPFLKVERFPEKRKPRYIPPEEDFWAVYDVAEGQDKVMLLSYLYLAARRAELFRLTWEDVDFLNRQVRLGTRKNQDGTLEYEWLPMVSELKKALLWWWESRPVKDTAYVFICTDRYNFCRQYYGQPFRKRQKLMKRLCKKAGVKHFGLHAIRHLSASTLYQAGQPVALIQAILRHKSASTTERYLRKLGLEQTREAMESVFAGRGSGKVLPFNKKEAPVSTASGA